MSKARVSVMWGHLAGLAVCLGGLAASQAQDATPTVDPALVGRWVAESITDGHGVQRWQVERRADGSFTARHASVGPQGLQEREVEGRWRTQAGVLHLSPALTEPSAPSAWRYTPAASDCLRMEAADPATGSPLKPAWRYGECRSLQRWPVPDAVHRTCVLDRPLFPKRSEVDLRIALEADGQRYAHFDGTREANPVEVRDYPVLADFHTGRPETMTNAGEALLTLVASNASRDGGLARTLGFDPRQARGARIYVLTPPRPQRPMEYFAGGRVTVLEAMDVEGRSLGMALYSPFVVACPKAAGD